MYDRLQFGFSVHIQVAERLGEFLRHKRHERFDLPFAGLYLRIHGDAVLNGHLSFETEVKIIDRQPGAVEGEMHLVEVHRHRSNQLQMQGIGIFVSFERRTYILRIEGDKHVIPALRFGGQFGLA